MANENLESKRWLIAGAAVVIQLCLGTVYAWSVFKIPLMKMHGWDGKTVQYTFMILMGILGLAAAFGGTLVDKKGPRFVATIGGILFGIGTLVAGYADQIGSITLLYHWIWRNCRPGQWFRLRYADCHIDPLVPG